MPRHHLHLMEYSNQLFRARVVSLLAKSSMALLRCMLSLAVLVLSVSCSPNSPESIIRKSPWTIILDLCEFNKRFKRDKIFSVC